MTRTHMDDYQRQDGTQLRLTFAEPERVTRGGIVVLPDADGVSDGVRLLVSSLAGEGWLAVAPHLDGESGQREGGQFSGPSIVDATDTSFAWLLERGVAADLLGVMGFDLGGTAALVAAASRQLGAAVSVGGRGITVPASTALPALVDIAGRLTSPWLGIYGDSGDSGEAAEVDRLRVAADAAEVATNVVRYPGANHRFDADPDAAAEAWQRTLSWFDAHLR